MERSESTERLVATFRLSVTWGESAAIEKMLLLLLHPGRAVS